MAASASGGILRELPREHVPVRTGTEDVILPAGTPLCTCHYATLASASAPFAAPSVSFNRLSPDLELEASYLGCPQR